VDSVVLVIDSVNGVEEQTRRLMEVCRMRNTPVIVFINKMDRDGKNRFDLLEEIEKELKIQLHPMTWPINSGKDFKGVYNLDAKSLLLFSANTKATDEDLINVTNLHIEHLAELLGQADAEQLAEDVELIDGVYGKLHAEDYLSGKTAPVFFGSAINNFGVKELLDTFMRIAPKPLDRETTKRVVDVDEDKLSGFVFKIHANLDPRHRVRGKTGRRHRNHLISTAATSCAEKQHYRTEHISSCRPFAKSCCACSVHSFPLDDHSLENARANLGDPVVLMRDATSQSVSRLAETGSRGQDARTLLARAVAACRVGGVSAAGRSAGAAVVDIRRLLDHHAA
jgi:hypothetical protein